MLTNEERLRQLEAVKAEIKLITKNVFQVFVIAIALWVGYLVGSFVGAWP